MASKKQTGMCKATINTFCGEKWKKVFELFGMSVCLWFFVVSPQKKHLAQKVGEIFQSKKF